MQTTIMTCWGAQPSAMLQRLKAIKLMVFDVDGTLTDGGVYLDNKDGEYKKFTTKDGLGIAQLQISGVRCAIITGRQSEIVTRRMQELKVDLVLQGISDKSRALQELKAKLGVQTAQVCAMGDDLNDLPMFAEAGFTACPCDAHPYMHSVCDLVLTLPGGRGAARQLTDLIMLAQGHLTEDGGPL